MGKKKTKVNDYATGLVEDVVRDIWGQGWTNKETIDFAISFLAKFTGTVLFKSLTDEVPDVYKKREDVAKYVIKNFSDTKMAVQEAVAAAFTGAVQTYSGQPIEYYCQVKPVGPAANKELI